MLGQTTSLFGCRRHMTPSKVFPFWQLPRPSPPPPSPTFLSPASSQIFLHCCTVLRRLSACDVRHQTSQEERHVSDHTAGGCRVCLSQPPQVYRHHNWRPSLPGQMCIQQLATTKKTTNSSESGSLRRQTSCAGIQECGCHDATNLVVR